MEDQLVLWLGRGKIQREKNVGKKNVALCD